MNGAFQRMKTAGRFVPFPLHQMRIISVLSVDAALPDGERHAIDGQHVSRDAVVHVVGLGVTHHIVKAVAQNASPAAR